MRSITRWAFVIGVALAGAVAALAQDRTQGGQDKGRGPGSGGTIMRRVGAPTLLMNESVQQELKLTDEQKQNLRDKVQEMTRAQREASEKLRDVPEDQRRAKLDELRKNMAQAGEKIVKEVLTPEQQRRLQQIQYQLGGFPAFSSSAEVQKKLNFTKEQKDQLKNFGEDYRKGLRQLSEGGSGPEAVQKVQALDKEYLSKALAILTDEQKQAWKELTGEPFELKCGGPRRRPDGGK